jgi:hypothetical protein
MARPTRRMDHEERIDDPGIQLITASNKPGEGPRSTRWKKPSATGSTPGTRTPNRSPGPRPPTTSSNDSPHIFIEFLAQDNSIVATMSAWRLRTSCVAFWMAALMRATKKSRKGKTREGDQGEIPMEPEYHAEHAHHSQRVDDDAEGCPGRRKSGLSTRWLS